MYRFSLLLCVVFLFLSSPSYSGPEDHISMVILNNEGDQSEDGQPQRSSFMSRLRSKIGRTYAYVNSSAQLDCACKVAYVACSAAVVLATGAYFYMVTHGDELHQGNGVQLDHSCDFACDVLPDFTNLTQGGFYYMQNHEYKFVNCSEKEKEKSGKFFKVGLNAYFIPAKGTPENLVPFEFNGDHEGFAVCQELPIDGELDQLPPLVDMNVTRD